MRSVRLGLVAAGIAALFATPTAGFAGVLNFGLTDGFETGVLGSQPGEFHDGDSGWVGQVEIVDSTTSPITAGPNGGSQFVKISPGPADSYSAGYHDGPFAHVGQQHSFPVAGNSFRMVVDIFAQAAAGASGSFWWSNGINDTSIADYASAWLTETGFVITPGDSTWGFTAKTSGNTVELATGEWYTMEVIFDRSGTELAATHNLYDDAGSLLYSHLVPDGSLGHDPLAINAGGPRYSWFTVWNHDTVDAIYIDNIGSGPVVPEPSSLALMALGTGLVAVRRWRRSRSV